MKNTPHFSPASTLQAGWPTPATDAAARQGQVAGLSAAVAALAAGTGVDPAGLAEVVRAAAPTDALCGHRSMNGRTCTREQGHVAKSHRYS